MKSMYKVLGIIVLAALVGCFMMGCDNGGPKTKNAITITVVGLDVYDDEAVQIGIFSDIANMMPPSDPITSAVAGAEGFVEGDTFSGDFDKTEGGAFTTDGNYILTMRVGEGLTQRAFLWVGSGMIADGIRAQIGSFTMATPKAQVEGLMNTMGPMFPKYSLTDDATVDLDEFVNVSILMAIMMTP